MWTISTCAAVSWSERLLFALLLMTLPACSDVGSRLELPRTHHAVRARADATWVVDADGLLVKPRNLATADRDSGLLDVRDNSELLVRADRRTNWCHIGALFARLGLKQPAHILWAVDSGGSPRQSVHRIRTVNGRGMLGDEKRLRIRGKDEATGNWAAEIQSAICELQGSRENLWIVEVSSSATHEQFIRALDALCEEGCTNVTFIMVSSDPESPAQNGASRAPR